MKQNINLLLASTISLLTLSAMNSSAVPIFAVSGVVTNQDGLLVNGLEVTVENRTRNIIGKSVTGETGDGRYDYGDKVASGVYFYTMRAGDFKATRKMVILR